MQRLILPFALAAAAVGSITLAQLEQRPGPRSVQTASVGFCLTMGIGCGR